MDEKEELLEKLRIEISRFDGAVERRDIECALSQTAKIIALDYLLAQLTEKETEAKK